MATGSQQGSGADNSGTAPSELLSPSATGPDGGDPVCPAGIADVDAVVAGQLPCEPRKRGWIWIVYVVLYTIAIPWYWPAGFRGPLVLGVPLWAAVSLMGVVALGVWTTFVIFRYWVDREEGD